MKVVAEPLQECSIRVFTVMMRKLAEKKCVLAMMIDCFDIREGKDVLVVRDDVVVKRLCVRFSVTGENIIRA